MTTFNSFFVLLVISLIFGFITIRKFAREDLTSSLQVYYDKLFIILVCLLNKKFNINLIPNLESLLFKQYLSNAKRDLEFKEPQDDWGQNKGCFSKGNQILGTYFHAVWSQCLYNCAHKGFHLTAYQGKDVF